ncbi:MAG: hypothetical protein GX444_14120 [Myxococcales bacterium]|nr:hypothetical protein [Myxococcales bacterium]
MNWKERLVRRLARRFHLDDSLDFIESMGRIGSEADVMAPTDLLPMAARLVTRGIYTQMAIQPNRDYVLPYWATRQFDENDVSFIPRMSWCAMNVTHRNWTAVGVPGSEREVAIDPRGLVTPWFEGWSLDTWLRLDDETFFPSRRPVRDQQHVENLPLVRTRFDFGPLQLELETFASGSGELEVVMLQARVTNTSDRHLAPTLYFSIRPFNPEGCALVKKIELTAPDTFTVNHCLGLQFAERPTIVYCSNGRQGDCAFHLRVAESRPRTECAAGLATAYAAFPLKLPPGETQTRTATATTRPQACFNRRAAALRSYDYADRRNEARAEWRRRQQEGLTVTFADRDLTAAFQRCKSHLLLVDDGDAITPGIMTYHHYWFRDAAYLVTALDRLGLHESAKRKLLDYPQKQQPDGFFLSQPGEWDSAGQAIWTLVEHARLTGDREYLIRIYESLVRGADWIAKTRRRETSPPTKGLLPPGFSAEHFGPNDYYYWDDFWGAAGLRDVAWAAEMLGMRDEWVRFERETEQFLADIRASLQLAMDRIGEEVMPTGPHRRFDCAAIGVLAALYPLRLFEPQDPWMGNTLAALRERCFCQGLFFQQMIHSGLNAYLSMHIAHCELFRRDAVCWPLIRRVLELATSAGTWPEAIHPHTHGGVMGDGMHLWAAADWLLLMRDLLLFEENDTLVITPAAPLDWFAWGSRTEVRRAPTHFGVVSYRLEGFAEETRLEIDADWRAAPRRIEWNFPFAATTAVVDGREINVNDCRVTFPAGTSEVRLKRSV